MSTNLIFRLDGKNIDGTNNSTLTSGTSKISSWFNSGITVSTFTQPTPKIDDTSYPLYNMDGAYFSNNIELESDITLGSYRSINIFMVFKMTATSSNDIYMWVDSTLNMTRAFIINPTSTITINYGSIISAVINFTFDINSIYIVNCEYDTAGSARNGYFWINNILKATFTCGTGTFFSTWFGSYSSAGNQLTGAIYEIIIINKVLSVTERNNIYDFLIVKWGSLFKISSMMGINLVLDLDGKNIDGTNNSTLTSGTSTISSWFNSGNVAGITTTFVVEQEKPTYTTNSAEFTPGKGFISTVDLFAYQLLNIIVVWKMKQIPDGYSTLWHSRPYGFRSLYITYENKIVIEYSDNYDNRIPNPIPINTTAIYNIEYNLGLLPVKFYINNILLSNQTIAYTVDNLRGNNPNSYYTTYPETYFGSYGSMQPIIGNIYEIIIINRLLSDTERTVIYNLLKTKWNVT